MAFGWLLLLAGLLGACADTAVAPHSTVITPPTDSQAVLIPSDTGNLEGRLFGAEHDVAVILSHMRPADQEAWFGLAIELSNNGYATLTYNFRGYGNSDGDEDLATLDDDLNAALAFMRDRGKIRIFLIGASMGGTASLVVAAQQDVAGVIALSPPSIFAGQDALEAMGGIGKPKLVIASEEATGDMVSLNELLEAARAPKEQETYSGTAHGTDLLDPTRSDHQSAVTQRILRFLDENREP